MVIDDNGVGYEPSVWDIEDSEPTATERVTNWVAMVVAVGVIGLFLPFLILCFVILVRSNSNVPMDSSLTKPSLP